MVAAESDRVTQIDFGDNCKVFIWLGRVGGVGETKPFGVGRVWRNEAIDGGEAASDGADVG